ncbi:hypothetical protein D3C87_2040960 [compost metagenome]
MRSRPQSVSPIATPNPPQTTSRHIGVSASPVRLAFCVSRTALDNTNTVDRQNT